MLQQEAVSPTAPVTAERTEALRTLVDRADRARAQAIANCQSLERAMSRTRAYVPGYDATHRLSGRVRELEETIDGLTKRLESQGPIEQAKGIIMAQTHCTPDQAFEILRRASQRSNTKLRLLALDLVARTSRTEATRAPATS
jgi:AmiR/NasT family two-component response regulator